MALFYRVLYPQVVFGDQVLDPGTLQRWQDRKYSSTHSRVPGPWLDRWAEDESRDPKDYPLCCEDVEYTPDALKAFLRFAPEYDDVPEWPEHIRNLTGEYVGVSAFDTPESALKYGQGAPKLYVVFEGVPLALLGPEKHEGGYRVRVIKEASRPMAKGEFLDWLRQHTCQN